MSISIQPESQPRRVVSADDLTLAESFCRGGGAGEHGRGRPRAHAAVIPVLTIRQPWAWAIVSGGKDVENRTWATAH